jgi:hypothetical protein
VLRVASPPTSASPGSPIVITGVARDVATPVLEKLGGKGTWLRSAKLKPRPDGTFVATVRPKLTTTYRLAADGVTGPALTVTVLPEAPE